MLRTLLVVGTFGVLLAYMLLVEARRTLPADPEATPTPWPILSWEIDDLQAVQFTDGGSADERTVRIEREGKGWRIVRPQTQSVADGAVADPHTVYFAFHELAGLSARAPVESADPDPATYGLDAPALTVTVETQAGAQQIYVGRQTADGTAFYVRHEGDPRVYVVDHYKLESLFEWLSTPPFQGTPTPGGQ
jgi:hypothetical protein